MFMYTNNDFKGKHGAVIKRSVDRRNRENLRCVLATERTTVEHVWGRHQLCILISRFTSLTIQCQLNLLFTANIDDDDNNVNRLNKLLYIAIL